MALRSFDVIPCGRLRGSMTVAERSPHVLVVDNYDSFTFNLVQCLTALGATCTVQPCDATSPDAARSGEFDGVLISPGPGTPEQAGRSLELIAASAGIVPVLGVCLGHQALAQTFGARVERAPRPVHGKTSLVSHDGRGVFRHLPSPFPATRYHSLLVAREQLPSTLEICAEAPDGAIMGLRHRDLPLEGVQFHPESILTEHGPRLVQNWLTSL
ncbi:MAG TPA: aminodeoxychorismate/anthranilate synthase component II [Polyangiaceae bacterium]|nr:aminodeoxychorismate/anthranilate synthase component II [Polyangiaceae bacterium]